MCMSDKTYIVIKGVEWLYSRLDDIGYKESYEALMKRIWKKDRTLSSDLLKQIIGGETIERKIS